MGIEIDRDLMYHEQIDKWKAQITKVRKKFRMMRHHERDQWKAKITLWHAYLKSQFLYGLSAVFPHISRSKQEGVRTFMTTSLKQALGIVMQS